MLDFLCPLHNLAQQLTTIPQIQKKKPTKSVVCNNQFLGQQLRTSNNIALSKKSLFRFSNNSAMKFTIHYALFYIQFYNNTITEQIIEFCRRYCRVLEGNHKIPPMPPFQSLEPGIKHLQSLSLPFSERSRKPKTKWLSLMQLYLKYFI